MNKFNLLKVIRHMVNAAIESRTNIGELNNNEILKEILAILVKHGINEN